MKYHNYKQIKLIVIDPHPIFREGLKKVLETDSNLQVVAQGDNGNSVLPLYKQHQPDAVLMEVNLPHRNGIQAVQELIRHFPNSKVLLFTVVDDSLQVSRAIRAGAAGYLLKDMDPSSITSAIKTVVNGGYYLHPKLTGDFLAALYKVSTNHNQEPFYQTEVTRPYHLLTRRETEVLQLMADGHSNKSLGEVLEISVKTVKNHVSTILRKMSLNDRTQAVVKAIKNGWVELR